MCRTGVCSATIRIFRTIRGSAKHLIDLGLCGCSRSCTSCSESGSGMEDCEKSETLAKTRAINGVLQCSVAWSSIPGHSASCRSGLLRLFTSKSS
ncbi:hypothetical protein HanRHA438_Chr09g0406901 [Helianthus annuus]|nr:hypothetical protein HanRHA438_Chr09g0406901 [Helianthus annuus]